MSSKHQRGVAWALRMPLATLLFAVPCFAQSTSEEGAMPGLHAWQAVNAHEEFVGDGRHKVRVTQRTRIARIGGGEIMVEVEQRMLIPEDQPVPANLTRSGIRRVTATARIVDLELDRIEVLGNGDLAPAERTRGASRGRYTVLRCADEAQCWRLTVLDITDTAPGQASNVHSEEVTAVKRRSALPAYWSDPDTAGRAAKALKSQLGRMRAAAE